jgi:hypothetical protein
VPHLLDVVHEWADGLEEAAEFRALPKRAIPITPLGAVCRYERRLAAIAVRGTWSI